MQYPIQLLYDLRDTTAWISGNELSELFKKLVNSANPNSKIKFNVSQLDIEAARLIDSAQFALAVTNDETRWTITKNNLTFLETFELRNQVNGFIVPNMAAIIISNQSFYKEDIQFEDGCMCIKGVNFLMCRWIH